MLKTCFIFIFCIFVFNPTLSQVWSFRPVGIECEYDSSKINPFETQSQGQIHLLELVQSLFPGGDILLKPWNKYPEALDTEYAMFIDELGREWKVVPEMMSPNIYDGYELVSPPLTSNSDLEKLASILDLIHVSGRFISGKYSSTHYTADVSDLKDENDDVTKFINLILFIENNIIKIYNIIQPQRYGTIMNEFAVPLSFNQRELLFELAKLPKNKRSYNDLRDLFLKYQDRELQISGNRTDNLWKLRAFNYAKFLNIGDFMFALILEMRLSDLVDSKRLPLIEKLFKALIEVGSKESSLGFTNPFAKLSPDSNFEVASQFISASFDLEEHHAFLKQLGLNPKDFPPPKQIKTKEATQSLNSCSEFLIN